MPYQAPRVPADPTRLLEQHCEWCCDPLIEGRVIEADGGTLYCSQQCRRHLHRAKRRVLWETHGPDCACVECMG